MTAKSSWHRIGDELERLLAELDRQDQEWADSERKLSALDDNVQLVFRELPQLYASAPSAAGGIRG